jgi:hypothetical protein
VAELDVERQRVEAVLRAQRSRMRFTGGFRSDNLLKRASTSDRARAEQISKRSDFGQHSLGTGTRGRMADPSFLGQ